MDKDAARVNCEPALSHCVSLFVCVSIHFIVGATTKQAIYLYKHSLDDVMMEAKRGKERVQDILDVTK